MMGLGRAAGYAVIFLISLLVFPAAGLARQVGEVAGKEGTGEYLGEFRTRPETDWAALEYEDEVILRDRLRTQTDSKLDVRVDPGHRFVLGQSIEVSVEEQRDKIVLVMPEEGGTLRVITLDRSGTLQVRTPTALAWAGSTGFIASCGPPTTADAESCLFVGVYGQTQVASLAFPGQPVVLQPRFLTLVRKGRLPLTPRRMPEDQFQALRSATTVLGTGSEQDRIGMTDPGAAGEKVFRADELVAKISQSPKAGPQPPGAKDPWTVIDQPPTVYDPGTGGHDPVQKPLPGPPPLPPQLGLP